MHVVFCRSNKIGSWLIRLLTFSKWSHVAVIMQGDLCIEATWPKVRWTSLEELQKTHTVMEERYFPIATKQGEWWVKDFLVRQIGKPYDISGLFALLNPSRDWRQDDKWFCSELVAAAVGMFTQAGRVTPQMLYLVSKEVPCQNNS